MSDPRFDHARARLWARYGFELTPGEWANMGKTIEEGKAQLLYRESNKRAHYIVKHRHRLLPVVYDHSTKGIVTFLPLTALGNKQVDNNARSRAIQAWTDIEKEFRP